MFIANFRVIVLLSITAVLCNSNICKAGVWSDGRQEVKHIIWRPGFHGFYVDSSNFHNPQGCSNSSAKLYLLSPSFENQAPEDVQRLYSMMLTAFAMGKPLHVWLDGCHNGYPQFTGLQINP
ncbi:hypothetical protein L2725_12820 [Shewanella corallii]|uniref:Uncharacterized protein n=1 Tax=Shewanella corallii TaxID=560080 RepID=A0ABT0N862_9GAMM|nr:hypothetical protein [Shewanella corallii]MCL2914651.1 hypothetical protein [Shewanella corallii]